MQVCKIITDTNTTLHTLANTHAHTHTHTDKHTRVLDCLMALWLRDASLVPDLSTIVATLLGLFMRPALRACQFCCLSCQNVHTHGEPVPTIAIPCHLRSLIAYQTADQLVTLSYSNTCHILTYACTLHVHARMHAQRMGHANRHSGGFLAALCSLYCLAFGSNVASPACDAATVHARFVLPHCRIPSNKPLQGCMHARFNFCPGRRTCMPCSLCITVCASVC